MGLSLFGGMIASYTDSPVMVNGTVIIKGTNKYAIIAFFIFIHGIGVLVFYFHPWEGFEKTPRLKLPLYNRVVSYYGISSALKKFEFLLSHFKFARLDQVIELARGRDSISTSFVQRRLRIGYQLAFL
jgi:DNA segregation ATPase FtsK/SpoIIIE-like protein